MYLGMMFEVNLLKIIQKVSLKFVGNIVIWVIIK
ncbi:hypothetical protein C8D97_102294 [Pleionea mediterranea]|uniref:Uncharacterized protein n=1 Tax=Pleionea mediterranea TaxID=523701 RepID=A0A316FYX2_9GAMM|nr:hypothetical protein C8D97_102294 [Pleionea mediterranea]